MTDTRQLVRTVLNPAALFLVIGVCAQVLLFGTFIAAFLSTPSNRILSGFMFQILNFVGIGVFLIMFYVFGKPINRRLLRWYRSERNRQRKENMLLESGQKPCGCPTGESGPSSVPFEPNSEADNHHQVFIRNHDDLSYADKDYERQEFRCVGCGSTWPVYIKRNNAQTVKRGWLDRDTNEIVNNDEDDAMERPVLEKDDLTDVTDLSVTTVNKYMAPTDDENIDEWKIDYIGEIKHDQVQSTIHKKIEDVEQVHA